MATNIEAILAVIFLGIISLVATYFINVNGQNREKLVKAQYACEKLNKKLRETKEALDYTNRMLLLAQQPSHNNKMQIAYNAGEDSINAFYMAPSVGYIFVVSQIDDGEVEIARYYFSDANEEICARNLAEELVDKLAETV